MQRLGRAPSRAAPRRRSGRRWTCVRRTRRPPGSTATPAPANEGRLSGTRAAAQAAPDPLPWGAGAKCQATGHGGAARPRAGPRQIGAHRDRAKLRTWPAGAHQLGPARLLKRVFQIDLEHCPNCGGQLKIIAAILESAVIERILTHLGLQARAPPRVPARTDFQQADSAFVRKAH